MAASSTSSKARGAVPSLREKTKLQRHRYLPGIQKQIRPQHGSVGLEVIYKRVNASLRVAKLNPAVHLNQSCLARNIEHSALEERRPHKASKHRNHHSTCKKLKGAFHRVLTFKRWHRWGGESNETGWRVKVMESLADRAAPAVVQARLVRFLYTDGHL
jgi:hypothetical protein